jgi:hypothetical protein
VSDSLARVLADIAEEKRNSDCCDEPQEQELFLLGHFHPPLRNYAPERA